MAAKNVDPLANNSQGFEMGAQHWVQTCGVCHAGGGQMEYDRELQPYSNSSDFGDKYVIEYASIDDPDPTDVTVGYMSATNKAEMDCLMCHLQENNPGSSWLATLDCGPTKMIGPRMDPTCNGDPSGYVNGMFRTIDSTLVDGVGEYDMFNRNYALKKKRLDLTASMGAGAKGVVDATGDLVGIDWGAVSGNITIEGDRIAGTPPSEACAVCHARVDDTMGLPGMMGMRTGYGNYGLIYDPSEQSSNASDLYLDTDNGPGAANNDYWFDFGCKTGMGKRAHKVSKDGDQYGTNGRYGMSMFLPSTLDMDPATKPNMGDPIQGKMPDIDVHDMAGMECGTCHYNLGSADEPETDVNEEELGYLDVEARTSHGYDYPAERVYGMDHQFAQADSFPDTKGKNNLDGFVSCESCHIDRDHPHAQGAPIPSHSGLSQNHLDKIGCVTCHIPETYSAPGRLKYRDWTVGFWRGTFRNMLDWNFDLITGSHKTTPPIRKWAVKNHNKPGEELKRKIYPALPSLMPTWYEVIPDGNVAFSAAGSNEAGLNATAGELLPLDLGGKASPVKNRDIEIVADWVRDNDPAGADFRLNGGNTVPLFDGFQLADSWEVDTHDEIDAMLAAFNSLAASGNVTAGNVKFLNMIQADFDVTHSVVPSEWALGGSERGGCVSCHSSMDPSSDYYSEHSVGFFEGYIQPINNAGMGVGGYDPVKNWFAMFADYDCSSLCGTGNDTEFFTQWGVPKWGTSCTNPGSPFGTIDQCVNMMASTFDAAMGFPSGTAMQMGMWDGIAGLQGFTVRELQTQGTLGCNPFAGPPSFSPMPGQSVNNCLPANGFGYNAGGAFDGTCVDANMTTQTPGACSGGFRDGGACMADADCQGAMTDAAEVAHNPGGLIYSRAEVRSHFKIDLQQAYVDDNTSKASLVKWSVGGELNPSHETFHDTMMTGGVGADGSAKWDQAEYCWDYNQGFMSPGVVPCRDPQAAAGFNMGERHIANVIPANAYLGYPPAELDKLMSLGSKLTSAPATGIHTVHTDDQAISCSSCHADYAAGSYDVDASKLADLNSITYKQSAAKCNEWSVDESGNFVCADGTYTEDAGVLSCSTVAACHGSTSGRYVGDGDGDGLDDRTWGNGSDGNITEANYYDEGGADANTTRWGTRW